MDNWGDPWADNAKTPTKDAVTSPLPPSFAPAPTILGGFLDDAGWGNEDESFGDWSTATTTAQDIETATPTIPARSEPFSTEYTNHETSEVTWDTLDNRRPETVSDQGDWAGFPADAPHDEEQVVSESSDSATTVQAMNGTESLPTITSQPEPEDDSSARTSTSPSEDSHNDAPADSPRTSYEEDRGGAKTLAIADKAPEDHISSVPLKIGDDGSTGGSDDDQVTRETSPSGAKDLRDDTHNSGTTQQPVSSDSAAQNLTGTSVVIPRKNSATARAFTIDSDLLGKLFPLSKSVKPLDDAPDDPIHSTPARKAWYRLTRKQTLREFNNGNDDDNYVRVTWSNSNIRTEVNNIVGRWAREDRIAGTGPGARASFYWDTSAPIDPKPIADLMRKRASAQAAAMAAPKQEAPPPLSTNVPAAFNWSSASAPADPWQGTGPGLRSTSSPMAKIDTPRAQMQTSGTRAASLDVSHEPTPPKHARNSTIAGETPAVTSLISPPIIVGTKPTLVDPMPAPERLENNTTPTNDLLNGTVDDEDEWGEMVSSPTVSTPTLIEPASRVDTRSNTVLTANITPHSIKSIKVEDESPDAMHASPIVRLRSTISPTSALFKANSFIPISVEQGPIGPGMLKSAKRSVSNTRKLEELPTTRSEPAKKPAPASVPPRDADIAEDFSWQTSQANVVTTGHETKEKSLDVRNPPTSITRPITPPQPETPPVETNVDAWADADFSFFESAPPAGPQPTVVQNASDSFSVFETRDRSSSAASSAKTFTRSPPRKVPTPPIQPLTGATSQAQRRKMEEEGIIEDILRGLPDLSYMLR